VSSFLFLLASFVGVILPFLLVRRRRAGRSLFNVIFFLEFGPRQFMIQTAVFECPDFGGQEIKE